MGIANRDYYRESTGSSWAMGDTPVVKYLILTTVVVFLLQMFSSRDARGQAGRRESAVEAWLVYDTVKVLNDGQIWRLLTRIFCHNRFSLFHILFNMLLLYWFGRELEGIYGSREFLCFYLAAGVAAGLGHVALDLATGQTRIALGASGAVMAVMMLFTLHYPRHEILLFFVIPIQMRWLMTLYVIWDLYPLLLVLSGDDPHTGIGHAAHLGGLVFGFLYYHFQWRLDRFAPSLPRVHRKSAPRPRPRLRIAEGTGREPDETGSRLDELLAKISRSGRDSLTPEEHRTLQAESERIRRRTQT